MENQLLNHKFFLIFHLFLYFDIYQDQIFESGALAEGSWNNQVQDWICQYTNSTSSLSTSSNGTGLLAVLQALKYANGYEYIFLQSNTMYGMKTLAVSSGLELNGFVVYLIHNQ